MAKKVKSPETPKVTSSFLLLDIKQGRKKIAKLVRDGYRIPFKVEGYIDSHPSGIGNDDGVSIEFASIVDNIKLGKIVLDSSD